MLPEGWAEYTFAEVAKIDVASDLKESSFSAHLSKTHIYPVYSNTVQNQGFYGYYDFQEYGKNRLTVVGRGIGLGMAFPRTHGFGAIGRLLVLSPKNNAFNVHYLADYINFCLQIHFENGAIPQLPGTTFGKYKVILPPISEQRKIAEILSTWDRAIEVTEKLIANARAQKKALMQHLLTGKKRLPGFKGKWETLTLRNIASIAYGTSPKGIALDNGAIPIIGTGGVVGWTDQKIDDGPAIIIGRKGTIDKPQLLGGPFWAIDTAYFCKPKAGYDLAWLFYNLLSLDFRALNEASGVPSLSRETLYSVSLNTPEFLEQQQIGQILQQADTYVTAFAQQIETLRQEKTALMQQLLTGKRRVKIEEVAK